MDIQQADQDQTRFGFGSKICAADQILTIYGLRISAETESKKSTFIHTDSCLILVSLYAG